MFLSSYRNTRESLRELEKAVETLACRLVFPQHFSFSQTSTRVSITRYKHGTCFLFLKTNMECEELTIGPDRLSVNSRRSPHKWIILAVITSVLAVVMTSLFTWHAVTYTERRCGVQRANATAHEETRYHTPAPLNFACPEYPTVVSLPRPLPSEIQHILDKLDSYLSTIIDENTSLPAISANVFHHDSVIWSGHYGSKTYNHSRVKPDGNTVYRIGSITKVFSVFLIYKLFESGVIDSVDDPLSKYAPDFDVKNPFTNENITLRQIASQMSGLPREAPCVYHCTQTTSTEQLKLLRNRYLVIEPWTTPSYSNLGYALLGRLLTENLLNKTFECWVKEEILDPLKMFSTGFEITSDVEKNMSFPYLGNGQKKASRTPFSRLGWLAPAGEMYSTLNDLTKLAMMFTRPWTQKILKVSTIREMLLPVDIAPDGRTVWGSPFEMLYTGGFVVRCKGGNIDTYEAFFTFEPRLQLGINVLISARDFVKPQGLTAMAIAAKAHDLLLPAINNTLFAMQIAASFPIDPSPFIGHFLLWHTLPKTLETFHATAEISVFQNILRLQYVQPLSFFIRITHIGFPYTFQASYHHQGISCWDKRSGILTDIHFDAPNQNGLSQNFVAPGWRIVGKRVKFDPNHQPRVLETETGLIKSFFQQPYFRKPF